MSSREAGTSILESSLVEVNRRMPHSGQLSRPIYRDGSSRRCLSVRQSSCPRLRILPVHYARQLADMRFLKSSEDSSETSGEPDMALLCGWCYNIVVTCSPKNQHVANKRLACLTGQLSVLQSFIARNLNQRTSDCPFLIACGFGSCSCSCFDRRRGGISPLPNRSAIFCDQAPRRMLRCDVFQARRSNPREAPLIYHQFLLHSQTLAHSRQCRPSKIL